MKIIQERLARAWAILTNLAEENKTNLEEAKNGYIDFIRKVEEKGEDVNIGAQGADKYLYPIQKICQFEGLPPLTGLVVQERKGIKLKPSSGFMGSGILTYEEEMELVLNYAWAKKENPFVGTDDGAVNEDAVHQSLATGGSVFSTVKSRGYAQALFRDGLLKAYNSKCAVCGIAFEEILDAAHIKPWSVCEGEEGGTLSNGILLCKNHHRSFDRGLWWLSDDFTVEAKTEFKASSLGKRTTVIWTPDDKAIAPDPLFLKYHRANKPG